MKMGGKTAFLLMRAWSLDKMGDIDFYTDAYFIVQVSHLPAIPPASEPLSFPKSRPRKSVPAMPPREIPRGN